MLCVSTILLQINRFTHMHPAYFSVFSSSFLPLFPYFLLSIETRHDVSLNKFVQHQTSVKQSNF